MKKLLLILFISFCFIGSANATVHNQIFEEGMAALKAGNYEQALSKFSLEARIGDYEGNATLMLGYMHMEGLGTLMDPEKALNFFISSAEKGSPAASLALGVVFLEGDYSCAFDLLERSVVLLRNEVHNLPTHVFLSQEDKKKRERVLETLATFKEAFNQIINSKDSSIPLGVILKSKLMLIELDNINPKENKLFDSTSQANKLGDQFIALINQSGKNSPIVKIINSCPSEGVINIIPLKELEQLSNNRLIELTKENGLEKELILDSYSKLQNRGRLLELFSYFCDYGFIRSGKSCAKIPDNASASGESSWKCSSPFKQSGNFCITIPLNASASGDGGWKCNPDYIRSGKSCTKIPLNASASSEISWKCNPDYIRSGKSCAKIPDNASASSESSWKCNSGFYKNGKVCLILPANAFASGESGWNCKSGYYKNDKVCIPLNASASGDGGWKCNPDYIRSGKSCAKIPDNASASSEISWKCNPDYIRSGKSCTKIPDNASASSEISWVCNSGYVNIRNTCIKPSIKLASEAYDKKDYHIALQHWLPFAEQGSIVSQLNVGLIFAEGMGTVAKDGAKAAYWYTRAADRGNSTAQIRLGDMYAIGFGVPYDRKQAFILYEKSAKQGDPRGQLSLGEAYIKGIGVLKSPIDAAYWVKKAYDNGLIRAGYIWDEYDLWKY